MKLWWNKTNEENQRTRRQTWHSTTSSTTNPIWVDKESKLDFRGKRSGADRHSSDVEVQFGGTGFKDNIPKEEDAHRNVWRLSRTDLLMPLRLHLTYSFLIFHCNKMASDLSVSDSTPE